MNLHIRTVRVLNIRIIFRNDIRDRIEQFIQVNVDAAGQVIEDDTNVTSIRFVLITSVRSYGNIRTCPQAALIVTVGIGVEIECVVIAIFIVTGEGNRGIRNTCDAVLFVDMSINGSQTRNIDPNVVGRVGLASVKHASHIKFVTAHIIAEAIHNIISIRCAANQHTVLIDIVILQGTIRNRPVQHGTVSFHNEVLLSIKILRRVETGGEAPNGTFHTCFTAIVALHNLPIISHLVHKGGKRIMAAELSRPVHQCLLTVLRDAKHQLILRGSWTQFPAQLNGAVGIDLGIIGWRRVVSRIGARHFVRMDFNGPLIAGGGGHKVIGAWDDGHIADVTFKVVTEGKASVGTGGLKCQVVIFIRHIVWSIVGIKASRSVESSIVRLPIYS